MYVRSSSGERHILFYITRNIFLVLQLLTPPWDVSTLL